MIENARVNSSRYWIRVDGGQRCPSDLLGSPPAGGQAGSAFASLSGPALSTREKMPTRGRRIIHLPIQLYIHGGPPIRRALPGSAPAVSRRPCRRQPAAPTR